MKKPQLVTAMGIAAFGLTSATPVIPAFAETGPDCGPAQVGAVISAVAGNCEAVFSVSGDYTFDVPEGSPLIHLLVIGAGGGATEYSTNSSGYGGGGGEVLFVDATSTEGQVDIAVGAGGDGGYSEGTAGGDSAFATTTARGGGGGVASGWSGASGNGSLSSDPWVGNGSIDEGEGAGYLPSDQELVSDSELFPAIDSELELGRGGRYEEPPAELGFGWGGSAWANTAHDGSDGAVIIRWKADSLAATGFDGTGLVLGSLAALSLGAASVLSTRRRHTR